MSRYSLITLEIMKSFPLFSQISTAICRRSSGPTASFPWRPPKIRTCDLVLSLVFWSPTSNIQTSRFCWVLPRLKIWKEYHICLLMIKIKTFDTLCSWMIDIYLSNMTYVTFICCMQILVAKNVKIENFIMQTKKANCYNFFFTYQKTLCNCLPHPPSKPCPPSP